MLGLQQEEQLGEVGQHIHSMAAWVLVEVAGPHMWDNTPAMVDIQV